MTGATRVIRRHVDDWGHLRTYRYWRARIMVDGRAQALGTYRTKRQAVEAYKAAKRRLR